LQNLNGLPVPAVLLILGFTKTFEIFHVLQIW